MICCSAKFINCNLSNQFDQLTAFRDWVNIIIFISFLQTLQVAISLTSIVVMRHHNVFRGHGCAIMTLIAVKAVMNQQNCAKIVGIVGAISQQAMNSLPHHFTIIQQIVSIPFHCHMAPTSYWIFTAWIFIWVDVNMIILRSGMALQKLHLSWKNCADLGSLVRSSPVRTKCGLGEKTIS